MLGCLRNIVVGFVIILVIALVLDAVTLFYTYWWVLLLIVLGIYLFRRFRKGRTDVYGKKIVSLNRLIKAAASDGVITKKERETLIQNRIKAGMDPDEAEIIVDARLDKLKVKVKKTDK